MRKFLESKQQCRANTDPTQPSAQATMMATAEGESALHQQFRVMDSLEMLEEEGGKLRCKPIHTPGAGFGA